MSHSRIPPENPAATPPPGGEMNLRIVKRISAPGISTLDGGASLSLRPQDRRQSGRSGEVWLPMKTTLVRSITECADSPAPADPLITPPADSSLRSDSPKQEARYPSWLPTSHVNAPPPLSNRMLQTLEITHGYSRVGNVHGNS